MNWNEYITQRREEYPRIIADRNSGMPMKEIVAKYGLSRQRIYKILEKYNGTGVGQRGGSRSSNLEPLRKPKKKRGKRSKSSRS